MTGYISSQHELLSRLQWSRRRAQKYTAAPRKDVVVFTQKSSDATPLVKHLSRQSAATLCDVRSVSVRFLAVRDDSGGLVADATGQTGQ